MKEHLAMRRFSLLFFCLCLLFLGACERGGEQNNPAIADQKVSLTIGGKDFTEQRILSKMTAIYLKEKGYQVNEVGSMASAVVRLALENNQIDLYWEYTGTALVLYQKQPAEADPERAYAKVSGKDKEKQLIWLNKADFNNTYAFLMQRDKAKELGIVTISDLANLVSENPQQIVFASNAEFYARTDGIQGLQVKYRFEFPLQNVVRMDTGLLYDALKNDEVDVSVGFATDGRIKGYRLVALEDDLQFFPAYSASPVVRQEVLEKNPEIAVLINSISERLDTDTIIKLNYLVDVEHQDVAEVVREWLSAQELL